MLIGVPKEIKNHEYRVGVTPDGVRALVAAGHQVRVEAGAGTQREDRPCRTSTFRRRLARGVDA